MSRAVLPLLSTADKGDLRPLYPHQERALQMLRASILAGHTRPLLQAPTGFGKTQLAAHVVQGALDKDKSVSITVPCVSLVEQTAKAFWREGIRDIGIVQADHPMTDPTARVQICSVQTLLRRQKPTSDVVLIDEAHRMFKHVNEWLLDPAYAHVLFVGLSATPWARGLGKYYDHLIVAARTGDLIESGFLAPFIVYAPPPPELSGVRTVGGDYHQGELSKACDKPELIGDAVDHWFKHGGLQPTIFFGVDCAHAQHAQQRFVEAGIAADYLDAYTDRAERANIIERFARGETKVICNVGCLTTGFDADVRCIIDARPTKSEMLFVQSIGRGLRLAPGKDKCVVLDHAGNTLRLGLVTDIHHEHLDDGEPQTSSKNEREKRAPLPHACENCKAVMPAGATHCPACGALREAKSAVIIRDGELVELGSRASRPLPASIAERISFYGELRFIASERGYSSGWSANKFREKFGVWPNDPRIRCADPKAPSLKTRQWVRSRAIAFAKGRARRHA